MIRFSCPGCEATFNVSDDKAGKTGKCPKCSSQFTIPLAPDGQPAAEVPPPLPTPPVVDGAAVEISPCPKCGARLSVEPGDIGLDVECPTCRTVYPAEAASAVKPRSAGSKSSINVGSGQKRPLVVADDDEDERPSRRRRREESRDDDDEDDRPSRRSRRDEEDDEEDRPRKKKRKKRRSSDIESKRVAAAILAFLLGAYGVHKFYLGYTGAGVIQLVATIFTCGFAAIIPFIEFILYIIKSDEDFIETYQIGQKEWF